MSSAPQPLIRDWSKHYDADELESIFRTIKAEKARSSKRPHIAVRPDNGWPQRPVHLPHAALDHNPPHLHGRYVATERAAYHRPAAGGVEPSVGVNIEPIAPAKDHLMSQGTIAHGPFDPRTFHVHQQLLEDNSHYFRAADRVSQDPTRSRGLSQRIQGSSNAQQAAGVDSDSAPPAHRPVAPLASSQVNRADPHANSQRPSMVKPPSRPPRRTGATVSSQSNDFTRYSTGQFEHSTDNVHWHPAVKYADIRDQLLQWAKRNSTYSVRQVHGLSRGDETAPVKGHENWGGARNKRPDELFQLFEPQGGIQHAGQRRRMIVEKRRVIDRDDRWMWHWDDVPVACCSLIEGWHMEALMRRNPELTMSDIQARMMNIFNYQVKEGDIRPRGPFGITTLTNRTMRFRTESFNVTWRTIGEGSNDIWRYIQSILPQQFIAANSTRGYRDMNTTEQAGLRQHLVACHERKKAEKQAVVIDDDGQSDGNQADLPGDQIPAASSSQPTGTASKSTKRKVQELIEISDDEAEEAASFAPKRQRVMPGAQTAFNKVDRTLAAAEDAHQFDVRPINGVKRTRGHDDESSYDRDDVGGSSFKRPRVNDGTAQLPDLQFPVGRAGTADHPSVSPSRHSQYSHRAQPTKTNHYAIDDSFSRSSFGPTDNINGISGAYRQVPVTPRQPPPRMFAPHAEAQHLQLPSKTMDSGSHSDYYVPNTHRYTTKPSLTVAADLNPNSAIPPKETTAASIAQPNHVSAVQMDISSGIDTSRGISTTPATELLRVDTKTVAGKSTAPASRFASTAPQESHDREIAGDASFVSEGFNQAAVAVIAPSPTLGPVELDTTNTSVSSGLSSPVSEAALADLAQEAASRAPSLHLEEESQSPRPGPSESENTGSADDNTYVSLALDENVASGSISPQSAAEYIAEELPEPPRAPARYNTRSTARKVSETEPDIIDSDQFPISLSISEMQAMREAVDAESALLRESVAAGRREIEENDRELQRPNLQPSARIIGESLFGDDLGFMNPETDTQASSDLYNLGFEYYYQIQEDYDGITLGDIEAAEMAHDLTTPEYSRYTSLQ